MNTRFEQRPPVVLLTGFLGSGKTTSLQKWLQQAAAEGLRLGVVINEFGEVNVDSLRLEQPGVPLERMTGGCLCCADDSALGDAMLRVLTHRPCDLIFIETSGLAEPSAAIQVLREAELTSLTQLHAVITVVDVLGFSRLPAAERALMERQISFANWIILSKCDCVHEGEIAAVMAVIAELNPSSQIVRSGWGFLKLTTLLAVSSPFRQGEMVPPHQHLHRTYRAVTWRFPVPVPRAEFIKFLRQLPSDEILRGKGFVRFQHDPNTTYQFDSVLGCCAVEECLHRVPPEAAAVLIGPHLQASNYFPQFQQLIPFQK